MPANPRRNRRWRAYQITTWLNPSLTPAAESASIGARRRLTKDDVQVTYSTELADIRYGCGLSPTLPPPSTPEALLDGLSGPDIMADRFAIPRFADLLPRIAEAAQMRRDLRQAGAAKKVELNDRIDQDKQESRDAGLRWFAQVLLRWVHTPQGLRERLAFFWADHFTAMGKNAVLHNAGLPYVEEAIRPNLAGTFADLLIAATLHPLMLHYLDQSSSVGPQSRVARRSNRVRGLNENLAREVMELHTLGVGGPYTQADVRQLAELFTGLSFDPAEGFRFRPAFAEPGPETVLGQTYGGDPADVEPIRAVLRDLAVHPATAAHMARKLAVHFVSDDPDPALVAHVAARWRASGGDLMAVYGALLEHPAAWERTLRNVKPPADFVASACRALAVPPERVGSLTPKALRRLFMRPLSLMGQNWLRPGGPDGWPEADADWITPQGLAARLRWAMTAPSHLPGDLPDPRAFVTTALGSYADDNVRFAAGAAETRPEAIGLVLASPAFQRR